MDWELHICGARWVLCICGARQVLHICGARIEGQAVDGALLVTILWWSLQRDIRQAAKGTYIEGHLEVIAHSLE